MEVRILRERDTKRYIALRATASKEQPRHITRDLERELFLFADHPTTTVTQHFNQGTVVWGVYDGNTLAGAVAISRRFDVQILNYLWLWGLYVLPRYRGTPVSRLLMEAVLAWCEQEPVEHRLLSSFLETNGKGRKFFFRWGFELIYGARSSENLLELEIGHLLVERERDTASPCLYP